ncbi:MAG: hydroxymethylbilane synthase [Candidatus Latescibacteria bacterium]|nr:hydroxymethylbilane synthase [Candidatus Latescibacterota bacterium]
MSQSTLIGSRGSKLALTQANMVRDMLQTRHPGLQVEVEVIHTRGDLDQGVLRSFGGVFTREIEHALLEGRIHLAVHSLKDLPVEVNPDLALVASPEREDVRDVLISRQGGGLESLPQGALLGTSSLRRRIQLQALRPDLSFADIRGNLDTRIAKVERGEYEGIILAAAGLHRLGWQERISAYLEPAQMLPAVGQAALGLQMRADEERRPLVEVLNHPPTLAAVSAERSLLRSLGGGCQAPIAAWGRIEGGALRVEGLVGKADGSQLVRAEVSGNPADAEALGVQLADELRRQGADALLGAT